MDDGLLLPDNPWGEIQRLPSIRLKKNLNVSTEKVLNKTASLLNEKLDVIPAKAGIQYYQRLALHLDSHFRGNDI